MFVDVVVPRGDERLIFLLRPDVCVLLLKQMPILTPETGSPVLVILNVFACLRCMRLYSRHSFSQ